MKEYHKIHSIFKRDMAKKGLILEGQWSLPVFEFLRDNQWVFTEKVDGTNIRLKWISGVLSVGGKTDNAQVPALLVEAIQAMNLARELAVHFPDVDVCLYGEGYGGKIQSGGCYRLDQNFVLFDVRIGEWWLERTDVEDIGGKLGLEVAPVVGEGTLADSISLVKSGLRSRWGDFIAEGIVARPAVELKTRNNGRVITKIKHVDFARLANAA